MLWVYLKRLLKEEEGYGTIEMLIIVLAVVSIGYTVSQKLTSDVFVPMHEKSVTQMKEIRNSGY